MGEEPCGTSRSRNQFRGIELDIWLDEKLEQLRDDFIEAIAAGEDERARRHIERFESSLDRLPRKQREEIIADTSVWLGEELRARGLGTGQTPRDSGLGNLPPSES